MADPTPFLSPSDSSTGRELAAGTSTGTSTSTSKTPGHKTSSLDDTIERCIGEFRWTQFLRAIFVSLAWAFDAQQSFIAVFTDADPPWHCTSPPNTTNNTNANNNYSCSSNICSLPEDEWSWDLPPYASTVSEWSLQCAGSFLTGLPASSFFMGSLAGGFLLAPLADSSIGRKNLLVLTSLFMSLSGLLTALVSTNVWIYAALRFLCGFGRSTVSTCALVLSTELVGKRWREQIGITGFLCFTLGFLSLPLIGYLNRGSSWRLVYVWTCIPPIFYSFLVHFFVCESPRWLYVRGRKEEFVKTLKSIAPLENRSSLTSSFFGLQGNEDDSATAVANSDFYSSMKAFWEKAWAFRRLVAVTTIGFGTGMVYYGMPLGLGSLAFNIYLSVTLNALMELPSALLTFFLVGKLKRKGLILGFTMVSGICSIICGCTMVMINDRHQYSHYLQMGLELASFFSACTAFNVHIMYTLELFPTCVKNSALSLVRQAVVFGGMFSPVVVSAGRNTNGLLSYGVFGMIIAVTGLFVGRLPETKGSVLCDTLEEEEQKDTLAATTGPAAALHDNEIVEGCV